MKVSIILLLLAVANVAFAAYCSGKPGDYHVNHEPIWSKSSTLLKTHKFGELHSIGEGRNLMKLIHVYGSSYQMGLAQGELLKE